MRKALDIFRKEPKGPVWIAAVQNAASARATIEEQCRKHPADYLIFNQDTETQTQVPYPPDRRPSN
jgi:hypothetical protein